jgi:hypothetical protein
VVVVAELADGLLSRPEWSGLEDLAESALLEEAHGLHDRLMRRTRRQDDLGGLQGGCRKLHEARGGGANERSESSVSGNFGASSSHSAPDVGRRQD